MVLKANKESEPMIFKLGDKIIRGYHVGKLGGKEVFELTDGKFLTFERGKLEIGDSIDEQGNLKKAKEKKNGKRRTDKGEAGGN